MSKIEYGKFITEPQGGKSTSQIFIFSTLNESSPILSQPPETGRDVLAKPSFSGQIFGLIEIEAAPNKKTVTFLDALVQEIKMAAASSFGKSDERTPEELFENFIQKTNYRYLELIGKKSASLSDADGELPKINAAIALLDKKNLYLATRGKIMPFLIYQTKPGNFRIMNIAESAAGKEGRTSKLSLFTNIVNGKIGGNDYLFFTTESILDYFSLEKISKTVSAETPEAAATTLKNLLDETANPETSFAFIIVKIKKEIPVIKLSVAAAPPSAETGRTSVPQHSMEGFLKTAADTEKMLTPSLSLNLGGKISSLFGRFKNLFKKSEAKNNARLEYYSSQFRPPARASKFWMSVSLWFLTALRIPYFLIKVIFSFLLNALKIAFYSITNWRGRRKTAWEDAAAGFKKIWSSLGSKMEKLPRLSRMLLFFAIIFVILFLGSTALLYRRYQNDLAAKSLEQITEAIQNKKSSIDASLIYNDEDGAKKTLAEADALLAEFPQKTKIEKDSYQNLAAEIEVLREKLMHIVNVSNPTVVANFPNYNPNAKVEKFIVTQDSLYAFDDATSVVYKINLKNNEVINQSVSGLNFELVTLLENNSSAILYQASDKKFFSLDLQTDVLKEIGVSLNENETQVDGLAVYNQKLYILDAKDHQIFKHVRDLTGFARGTPWFKGDANIGNAKSIAIDGSIYVGTSDGKILKFENGQQVEFVSEALPAFSSAIKVWTSFDSSFIYVLEPSARRLVVLDKQGKLKTQYTSDKFSNLVDFSVNEKTKKIYLLSGNFVYEIPATNF